MTRPLALALVAMLLAGAPSLRAQDADACETLDGAVACRWIFNAEDRLVNAAQDPSNATSARYDFRLPVFARTLATVSVVRTGPDHGWNFTVEEVVREDGASSRKVLSASQHPQQVDGATEHRETTTHLLLTRPDAEYWLRFTPGNAQMRQQALPLASNTPSRYHVSYVAEALPEGVVPARSAGTADDPQLADVVGEIPAPDLDIVSAWFDDARVGDGLMDVHLRVRSLESVTFRSPWTDAEGERVEWKLAFYVRGQGYYVSWETSDRGRPGAEGFSCALRYESESDTQSEQIVSGAHCVADRATATFHATFPTRAIGPPADGEVFERLTARTRIHHGLALGPGSTSPIEVVDDGPVKRYDFALGGPAVWSVLDGGRKDPVLPAALAWYEAPLASENIPDTLQVAGALLAALTTLVGVALLARARRDTRRLLARVDEVERQHEADAKRALLELGRLETELAREFRRGRIREAQYQVASQRIATAAARMALRRDLGLDDGIPDARTIPVEGEPVRSRAP